VPTKTIIPRGVIIGLFLAVVLDTFVQISWKFAVSGFPENAAVSAMVTGLLSGFPFYMAMLGVAAQYANWMRVLARADLSFAQPITAISYITVLALSSHAFHEKVSPSKVLGITLILLGVFFISRTPHHTTRADLDS
jgi:drug/metabolite transporter (DMT)-like permease